MYRLNLCWQNIVQISSRLGGELLTLLCPACTGVQQGAEARVNAGGEGQADDGKTALRGEPAGLAGERDAGMRGWWLKGSIEAGQHKFLLVVGNPELDRATWLGIRHFKRETTIRSRGQMPGFARLSRRRNASAD